MNAIKILYALVIFMLIFKGVNAQEPMIIELKPASSELSDRNFYIDEVIDARELKDNIGRINPGDTLRGYELKLSKGTETALLIFFLKSYPKESAQAPIKIRVNELTLKKAGTEISVKFKADYLYQDVTIYSDKKLIQTSYANGDKVFRESIEAALMASLIEFNNSGWEQIAGFDASENSYDSSLEAGLNYTDDYQINEAEATGINENKNFDDRNVVAVGYQIGGLTLIGVDYTLRMTDVFGVHLGAGLTGYTAGIKLHFKPTKKSSFINVSFKDAGFGMMQTVGAEFGFRWVFREEGTFGLHGQIGLAGITLLDEEFKNQLYGTETEAPPATLSVGLGFSW